MYGSIIGAAASLVGGLVSNVIAQDRASNELSAANREIDNQEKNVENWYWNTKGDKTERADIKELGRMVTDSVRERNEAAANPIAQNTAEGQAAVRAQNAQDIASFARSTTAQLAAENAANDDKYLERRNAVSNQRKVIHERNAQNIANAGQQLVNTFVNSAGGFANGMSGNNSGSGGNLFDSMFTKKENA